MYPQVTIVFKKLDIIIVVSLHEDVAEKASLAEVWRVLHAMDNELECTGLWHIKHIFVLLLFLSDIFTLFVSFSSKRFPKRNEETKYQLTLNLLYQNLALF